MMISAQFGVRPRSRVPAIADRFGSGEAVARAFSTVWPMARQQEAALMLADLGMTAGAIAERLGIDRVVARHLLDGRAPPIGAAIADADEDDEITPAMAKCLALFGTEPLRLSARGLSAAIGVSIGGAHRTLKRMKRTGMIVRGEDGAYRLTAIGSEAAASTRL